VFAIVPGYSATVEQTNGAMRVEVQDAGSEAVETIFVKVDGAWTPALSADFVSVAGSDTGR
jgi:hypothetical protein